MSTNNTDGRSRKKNNKWWFIILGIVLIVVLAVVAKKGEGNQTKVAVDKLSRHTITEMVSASGKIYPETEVKISPEVSGEIIVLNVQEGDSVHKGDLLVKINPAIYSSLVNQAEASVEQTKASSQNSKQMMAQAESQYNLAKSTYERNLKLYKDKVISSLEFEQSEASYKSALASLDAARASSSAGQFGIVGARAGLSQAQENLLKTTIIAPTSGIISQLNVKKGERVVGTAQYAGTEMLTIADMSRIEVRVDVSETVIPKVKIGDTAEITTEAYRDRKFLGVVSKIAVSAKTTAATASTDQVTNYTVHVYILPSSYTDLVDPKNSRSIPFKPGMSSSVDIRTNRQTDVLSVPVNAVATREWSDSVKKQNAETHTNTTRKVVFVYDSKSQQVKMRDVQTGLQDNTYLQITGGLKEGEEVVVAPYSAVSKNLTDGQKVKVVTKDQLFDVKGDK